MSPATNDVSARYAGIYPRDADLWTIKLPLRCWNCQIFAWAIMGNPVGFWLRGVKIAYWTYDLFAIVLSQLISPMGSQITVKTCDFNLWMRVRMFVMGACGYFPSCVTRGTVIGQCEQPVEIALMIGWLRTWSDGHETKWWTILYLVKLQHIFLDDTR